MLRNLKIKAAAFRRTKSSQKRSPDDTTSTATTTPTQHILTEQEIFPVRSPWRDLVSPAVEGDLYPTTSELDYDPELEPASEPAPALAPVPEPELEPEAEEETEAVSKTQESDPYASKYVPFAEASVLRGNILSQPASHYGRVNASIMQGFGGDDESIWLVDDEETDDEVDKSKKDEDGREVADREEKEVNSDQITSESKPEATRPSGNDISTPAATATAQNEAEPISAAPEDPESTKKRGYAPISASILAGFDSEEEPQPQPQGKQEPQPQLQPQTPPSEEPQENLNPYVALLEKQNHSMTVSCLRHLNQSEGKEAADEFR